VREDVTISYRGASYAIGRGQDFYGIWPAGAPQSPPAESWPATPEGWYAAWSRFTVIEAPGTIVPVTEPSAAAASANPAATTVTVGPDTVTAGTDTVTAGTGQYTMAARTGQYTMAAGAGAGPGGRAIIAAVLLAAGVVLGVAGLFPGYLAGASLAQEPGELVPHVIYLAAWSVSAVLILLGGGRPRAGALLGTGTAVVTLGFFLADAGTPIAGGARLMGAGLVLGLAGWLACAAGCALAFRVPSAGWPGRTGSDRPGSVMALTLTLAGLGAAIAFAPSWDSYTLRTSDGLTQHLTAGNAFANPGPVIAGDVVVMVALVAAVIAAAATRPLARGAVLLAGATIPMLAQVISALIELGEGTSPALFGISPAQAARAGLTISSGVTPAFWLYCAFVLALVAACAWMLIPRPQVTAGAISPVTSALSSLPN
jgi:hypothetical protein